MASSPQLRVEQHQLRSERHRTIGTLLADAGDEWAAVPMFYAAYHLVKAAMVVDPIWWDQQRLKSIDLNLTSDDRFVDRHHGRRHTGGVREWGINEIVLKVYPVIVREYEKLHQASIQVRYGAGLPAGALLDLDAALTAICGASERDELVG